MRGKLEIEKIMSFFSEYFEVGLPDILRAIVASRPEGNDGCEVTPLYSTTIRYSWGYSCEVSGLSSSREILTEIAWTLKTKDEFDFQGKASTLQSFEVMGIGFSRSLSIRATDTKIWASVANWPTISSNVPNLTSKYDVVRFLSVRSHLWPLWLAESGTERWAPGLNGSKSRSQVNLCENVEANSWVMVGDSRSASSESWYSWSSTGASSLVSVLLLWLSLILREVDQGIERKLTMSRFGIYRKTTTYIGGISRHIRSNPNLLRDL